MVSKTLMSSVVVMVISINPTCIGYPARQCSEWHKDIKQWLLAFEHTNPKPWYRLNRDKALVGTFLVFVPSVDQDYTKAFEWWTKSSEQGSSLAMSDLGYCYSTGHGCDQNRTKDAEWYEKSANLGYSRAMHNIGSCYQYGWGVTKDVNQAREWFTKAAAQGDANALHVTALDRLNVSNN